MACEDIQCEQAIATQDAWKARLQQAQGALRGYQNCFSEEDIPTLRPVRKLSGEGKD